MKDKKKFVELMTGLCEIFGKPTSQFIYKAYFMALNEFSDEEAEAAIYTLIKTHKFRTLPTPANIIDVIVDNRKKIAGNDIELLPPPEEERLTTDEIKQMMKENGLL